MPCSLSLTILPQPSTWNGGTDVWGDIVSHSNTLTHNYCPAIHETSPNGRQGNFCESKFHLLSGTEPILTTRQPVAASTVSLLRLAGARHSRPQAFGHADGHDREEPLCGRGVELLGVTKRLLERHRPIGRGHHGDKSVDIRW